MTMSIMPGITTYMYLDEKGVPLKTTMNLLNVETVSYNVSKEEALKALSGAEVDLAVATLVKTEKRIDRARDTRQVVYRVTIPGEDPEAIISKGPTQLITRVNPNTIDLTVRAISPPDQVPENTEPPGKEFLASNTYLQSDDELVKKHAADAVGDETGSWKSAQLMEHWVWENLKKKNFSTLLASAAEVAKDLSGDCTEHSVLLAAMCRSRGIPSRVAVGLVFVPSLSAFGGHMWTEVFVKGTWIPLDATLGKGGIAADHIKFTDSSFSDEGDATPMQAFLPMVSALGKMKIEVKEITFDK
jgi:transglutaminase-like putative cysteine protease